LIFCRLAASRRRLDANRQNLGAEAATLLDTVGPRN
jgi:hypothetical protein